VSGYVIRTPQGNKGPFSKEQIQQLVDQGKVPVTLRVISTQTGQPVLVADVIQDEDSEFALDLDMDDFGDDIGAAAPPPPRSGGASRAAGPGRTAGRQAPVGGRGRAGGASGRDGSGRGGPGGVRGGGRTMRGRGAPRGRPGPARGMPEDGPDGGRGRYGAPRKKSSPAVVGAIVGGVVLVLGIGLWFAWPYMFGGGIDGTWMIDTDYMVEVAVKNAKEDGASEAEVKMAVAFVKGFIGINAQSFELTIDGDTVTGKLGSESGTGKVVGSAGGGWTKLELTEPSGKTEFMLVKPSGRRLLARPDLNDKEKEFILLRK